MNDHDQAQAAAPPNGYARELDELLNLLETVDRDITPEHVAQRFLELLDDIGSSGEPPPGALSPTMSTMECPCGEPHPASETMDFLVAQLGECTPLTVVGLGTWLVPRIYIAMHGIKARELPRLAVVHGFEPVPRRADSFELDPEAGEEWW